MKKKFQISLMIIISLMSIAFAVNSTTNETLIDNNQSFVDEITFTVNNTTNETSTKYDKSFVNESSSKEYDEKYESQSYVPLIYNYYTLGTGLNSSNYLYWNFDNNLLDATGNGHSLSNGGATYISTGKINGSFNFDGNDYMTSGNYAFNFLHDGTTPWTISVWEKHNTSTGGGGILGNTVGVDRLGIYFSVTNRNVYFSMGRTSPFPIMTASWIDALPHGNQYNHIMITYNPSTDQMKLYVNGEPTGNTFSRTNPHLTGNSFYSAMQIGRSKPAPSYGYYTGQIDEFSIWTRELTNSEVSQIYNSGNGLQYPYIDNTLNKTEAKLIIEDTFNTNLTNPVIEYNQSLYIEYQNSTIRKQVFDYFISYGNKRYAINYGNTSYANIESIRTTLNILQLAPVNEENLKTQLATLIDNSLN